MGRFYVDQNKIIHQRKTSNTKFLCNKFRRFVYHFSQNLQRELSSLFRKRHKLLFSRSLSFTPYSKSFRTVIIKEAYFIFSIY